MHDRAGSYSYPFNYDVMNTLRDLQANVGRLEDELDEYDSRIENMREERLKKYRELQDARSLVDERKLENQRRHSWLGRIIETRKLEVVGMMS